MKISEETAKAIDILTNTIIKLITGLSCNVSFWVILVYIIRSNEPKWNLTILDSILGGTMFVLVAHYWPAFKSLQATKKRK